MENVAYQFGTWSWDDITHSLYFTSQEVAPKPTTSTKSSLAKGEKFAGCTHADLNIVFKDTVDTLEKIRFRRKFQRHVKVNEPDVVTIRDIKDIVLFQTPLSLPVDFINLFHTQEVDRLLRALIVYFQLFLQTYDILMLRREHSEKKLPCPRVLDVEEKFRSDLCVYRAMVAREYVNILLGYGNLHHYLQMSNKQNTSSGERDTRIFELLYRLSGRVVWIALRRHYGNMIEIELNRLFRTDAFNLMEHQLRRRPFTLPTPHENTILHGFVQEEAKLFSHSPLYWELLRNNDFCMLGIGYVNFKSYDPRIYFLQKMFDCPEEQLIENCITIGILGLPRVNFDVMLVETVKHHMESDHEVLGSLAVNFTDLFKSDVQFQADFRLPSISIEEPVPNNFPRNNVPTPDYHSKQREDARIMWKMHMSHPQV